MHERADAARGLVAAAELAFDAPHHQMLERDATRALARRDFAAAFRFADRRCRIDPPAGPHVYVLRAEALFRMGERRSALADLVRAIAAAPDDIAANRRLLVWGRGRRREQAAATLIAEDHDAEVLRDAVTVLWKRRPLGALRVLDDRIRGWATWQGNDPVEIAIDDSEGGVTSFIAPDPDHPLAGAAISAAAFDLPRPRSQQAQTVRLALSGTAFLSVRAAPNQSPPRRHFAAPAAAHHGSVTVIVPVYGDFEATRTCLDALCAELLRAPRHRALIVNDASPDARIPAYLEEITERPGVTLMTNGQNLGFVGAVNLALGRIAHGDIILLNADTVPPPGFIDRLAAAAHGSRDIGTVVPFSNNGELTSFPLPARENPLAPIDEVIRLDRIAERVNAGRIVDIPSGTGFCLYVTRACLDAVGPLSENFQRGYFEDIDFSLRARGRGFRAVCAASVYVGHAGSRSFGPEKASLAIRNFRVLAGLFPGYADECAAFGKADPLRPLRAAIEHEAVSWGPRPRLLVTGATLVAEITEARAAQLLAEGERCVVLRGSAARGSVARLADAAGAMPQSMAFDLGDAEDRRRLASVIGDMAPAAIEIHDPAATPSPLLDMVLGFEFACDLLIGDDGLQRESASPDEARREKWMAIRKRVRRFLAPDARAEAYAARILSGQETGRLMRTNGDAGRARPAARAQAGAAVKLGVVPARSSPDERRLVRALALALRDSSPEAEIIVLGEMPRDTDLMRFGNVFVCGPTPAAGIPRTLRHYRISHVLTGVGRPLFGHPATGRALGSRLPVATVDWSGGQASARDGDLTLLPEATPSDVAGSVAAWLARGR